MRSEGMAKEMPAATLSVLMPMTSPSWRGDRSSGHCARLAVAPLPEALWAAEAPRRALPGWHPGPRLAPPTAFRHPSPRPRWSVPAGPGHPQAAL